MPKLLDTKQFKKSSFDTWRAFSKFVLIVTIGQYKYRASQRASLVFVTFLHNLAGRVLALKRQLHLLQKQNVSTTNTGIDYRLSLQLKKYISTIGRLLSWCSGIGRVSLIYQVVQYKTLTG
jgi:hypothetical protein